MAQWTIYCDKPPKDLSKLIIEVHGAEVCCDDWRYRMTAYNNGEFVDHEIFFEESTAPPDGKEDVLCELLVEALVGQAISLERIGCIDNSGVPDVEQVDRATPMRHLRRHLDDVLSAVTDAQLPVAKGRNERENDDRGLKGPAIGNYRGKGRFASMGLSHAQCG